MDTTLEKILDRVRGAVDSSDERLPLPQSIADQILTMNEETILKGIHHLFKESQINNVVEYFRRFRDPASLVGTRPLSSILTKTESLPPKTRLPPIKDLGYKKEYAFSGHSSKVLCLMFDRSETVLFTGGEDGLIKMWDVYSGRALKAFREHTAPVFDFVISGDNKILVSCDQEGTVLFWDVFASPAQPLAKVAVEEQIDFLEIVYPSLEPAPLEQKRAKAQPDEATYRVFLMTCTGRALRLSLLPGGKHAVEVLMNEIEEASFNQARSSRGKRLVAAVGLWPFSMLFDTEDPDGRFYMLDTDDMLTSAVDIGSSSLKIVASTYSSSLFIWKYHPETKSARSNMPSRKTFKGRDLEGAWIKETVDIEGLSSSVFITDIVFLCNDDVIVSVDQESNIRIIKTSEGNRIVFIEKDFKICGITPHPFLPIFITLEINGNIKFISDEGVLLSLISSGLSVTDGVFFHSSGNSFFVTETDGSIHKYALSAETCTLPPSSEFFRADFVFLRDRQCTYSSERVQAETVSRMSGILDICNKTPLAPTYSALGEPITEQLFLPSIPPLFECSVSTDASARNQEIASVLLLQPNMINSKTFEREYRATQPPASAIVIEESEESNTTINVSSSDAVIVDDSYSDSNFATSSQSSSDDSTYSVATDEQSEDPSSDMNRSESAELPSTDLDDRSGSSDLDGGSGSTESEGITKRRRRQPRRKASKMSGPGSRSRSVAGSGSRSVTGSGPVSEWLTSVATFPLIPQVEDRLVLIPSRLAAYTLPRTNPNKLSRLSSLDLCVLEVVVVKTVSLHENSLVLTLLVERLEAEIRILYAPSQTSNDPFVIHQFYLDQCSRTYLPDEEVYFRKNGLLSKGRFVSYAPAASQTTTASRTSIAPPPHKLTLSLGQESTVSSVFDVQCLAGSYSSPVNEKHKEVLGFKTPETSIFFSTVPRKTYPDYYELVPQPLPLNRIVQRMKKKHYRTKASLLADLSLVLDNCLLYNEEASPIVAVCRALVNSLQKLVSSS
ncbi:hypothetical protein NEDG_00342 [Nematocida displodere]|uniref:Bromo domain-containing protein n=1 Tax=Nematocida displodere TaxID=1805483 RepID=A0A177EIW0_9MICR|nr:hypothetical protein NEDG_00342 [Nematocida displodere]